ncbi:mechanosensitive ion channel family protein [Botrimarina sp.]|uniref:mechanosensitive ion channel family protein n=1 Tax=Botrimarina sp. TaxID=2795802 RepID=UPI0032EC603D
MSTKRSDHPTARLRVWGRAALAGAALVGVAAAQDPPAEPPETAPAEGAPGKVDVEPVAEDQQIAARLERILRATEWYESPGVRVDEGVVFLTGSTDTDDRKAWAAQLAKATQDVVAVVNGIRVRTPSLLDFTPAYAQLREMGRGVVQSAPAIAVAVGLLLLAWLASLWASKLTTYLAEGRIGNRLLRGVLAKAAGVLVMVIGAYLALQVADATRLAATVLGGTGLLGIVIGIAFRDIAENFLASLLISVQRPFEIGDLVTIEGRQGFVQAVTTRGTQLMTLDGNHVQIPNSIVYKSVIENTTANPNVRLSFLVGVDYADSAAEAQRAVLQTLRAHEAVLDEPEPLVLVDELATSTVNLRVYFWVNGHEHSVIKVRSAVMRQVKRALQQGGFTLPDESREMIFPQGVPVTLRQTDEPPPPPRKDPAEADTAESAESAASTTEAEGGLAPESVEISRQAAASRPLERGENLL